MSTPFSFEVYTPRDDAAEVALYGELSQVAKLDPSFLSVTYWVDGTLTDRSLRILSYLSVLKDAKVMAHVAYLGMPRESIRALVNDIMDIGVDRFLALRGDFNDSELERKGKLSSAAELVEFIHQLWAERLTLTGNRPHGGPLGNGVTRPDLVTIAVTAYPHGRGRLGGREEKIEMETLLAKQSAGASFAIAQRVFHADDFLHFAERVRDAGVTLPIIPGIMPVLTPESLTRMSEHFELTPHKWFRSALLSASNQSAQENIGIDQLTILCHELLEGGITGLHFFTHNHFGAVLKVLENLGILGRGKAEL